MRILLVAALGVEATPLYPLLEKPRPLSARLTVGRYGEVQVGVLVSGVGPAKAARRTRGALALFPAERVISVGTCGALDDAFTIGDVCWARHTGRPDLAPRAVWSPRGPHATVVTVPRPVFTPEGRSGLASQGWQLVEMEADAVRQAVGEVQFGALKVVSDHAGREPDDALATGRLPSPAAIARFKARALGLVARGLVPVLRDALRS